MLGSSLQHQGEFRTGGSDHIAFEQPLPIEHRVAQLARRAELPIADPGEGLIARAREIRIDQTEIEAILAAEVKNSVSPADTLARLQGAAVEEEVGSRPTLVTIRSGAAHQDVIPITAVETIGIV
jgi:hypothetical protein